MTWRYTTSGREMSRPDSEYGIHVGGPLAVEDCKAILGDIVDEIADQAKLYAEASKCEP